MGSPRRGEIIIKKCLLLKNQSIKTHTPRNLILLGYSYYIDTLKRSPTYCKIGSKPYLIPKGLLNKVR